MKRPFILLLSFFFIKQFSYAQYRADSYFKNGDKITFIGNSITHGTISTGRFHNYILLYYATRFPNERIAVYNAGIWGDNVNGMGRRMEDDYGVRNAQYSLVMAGMNDVNRSLYDPARQEEVGIETQKQRALSDYKAYYKVLIQKLLAANTKVILQKPSIYDQTATIATPNMIGVNDALQACNVIIDELAAEFNLETVDYWTILNSLNQQVQLADPSTTLISNDRIHPAADGNLIMAYQFLKTTNAPKYVSNTEIESGVISKNEFCEITDLATTSTTVSFKYKAESLPFPVTNDVDRALSLIPFQSDLNMERLKVTGLAPGKYGLEIDGKFISSFTNSELTTGVNLALFENTPQYVQTLAVKEKTDAHRDLQVKLRDIKLIEINYLAKSLWTDFTAATAYINDLKNRNVQPYVSQKSRFDAYLVNKPNESVLEDELGSLIDEIYTLSKPEEHSILISPNVQTHSWEFNHPVINNQIEGWTILNYTNANTTNSILTLNAAQTYCYIRYDTALGPIEPLISKKVVIKLKNNTSETKARFYWWGTNATAAFIEFPMSANDTDYKEYTIDLNNDARWSGHINYIRFDVPSPVYPVSIGQTVNVDYIKLTENNVLLPVSLISFTASNQNNTVALRWSTASENNNSHFDVLRSEEGKIFKKLGSVSGKNKSNAITNYEFVDENPVLGTSYYQLKQIDLDGTVSPSKPVSVNMGIVKKMPLFNIYKDTAGKLIVSVSVPASVNTCLLITDIIGKEWLRQKYHLLKGNNVFEIPVQLQTGLYVATMVIQDKRTSIKFIL
ncbi:MAG TPA: SGNH/GDSL hydrolase family protein [Emticicia sp.]